MRAVEDIAIVRRSLDVDEVLPPLLHLLLLRHLVVMLVENVGGDVGPVTNHLLRHFLPQVRRYRPSTERVRTQGMLALRSELAFHPARTLLLRRTWLRESIDELSNVPFDCAALLARNERLSSVFVRDFGRLCSIQSLISRTVSSEIATIRSPELPFLSEVPVSGR